MKASKNLIIGVLLTGVFAISAVCAWFAFQVDSKSVQNEVITFENTTTYEKEQEQVEIGIPVRLKIPIIDVDAVIESKGLTSDGSMDISENMENVGWFELGKRPGEIGSSVIAGHYGIKNGKASVFDDLHKLNKGDNVYVEDDSGAVISFVVRESRSYDSNADTSDVFESDDGKSHLNFVTCEGDWDKVSKSYPKRLVVFTDKE